MTARQPIIAVAFYSTYGHIATLADSVIKGVEASGAIVKPYCIQETLSQEILGKMHGGASLNPKYPILTPDALKEVDGVIFGCPTRYGRVAAQLSAFFDQCGGLWATGALVGKFAATFTSTAGQHGGQETTALTTVPFFAHMGMCYVPLGYTHPFTNELNIVAGSSPWGASTIAAGDGSRQPLPQELEVAEHQGKTFASFVGTYVRGKHLSATSAGADTSAVSAKEVPSKVTESTKDGYNVPALEKPVETAPAATSTPVAATNTTTPTAATASEPAPTATTDKAVAPTTAPPAQPKKKGGLFASCCGGRGIDD